MDLSQFVFILCRLGLTTIASFLAILFWSRTRDVAWILVILAVIMAYVETIYSILSLFGINGGNILSENLLLLMPMLLGCLPPVFIIAAFAVMIKRKYRR